MVASAGFRIDEVITLNGFHAAVLKSSAPDPLGQSQPRLTIKLPAFPLS